MFELIGLGLVKLIAVGICGLIVAGFFLVLWIVVLPFRLIGFLLKGLIFLLALPFLLLFAALGLLGFGVGAFVFLVPFAPFALLAFVLWRWMRGRSRATVSA